MTNPSAAKGQKSPVSSPFYDFIDSGKHRQNLVEEIETMLAYAMSSGIQLDAGLQKKIATLFSTKVDPQILAAIDAESPVPVESEGNPPNSEPIGDDSVLAEEVHSGESSAETESFELILQIHGGLSALIAPATPISLNATKPLGWGWRINNPVINGLIYVTLGSLVLFMALSAYTLKVSKQTATEKETATATEQAATDSQTGENNE